MTEASAPGNGLPPEIEAAWRHPAFGWTLACFALLAASAPLWWGSVEAALYEAEFALAAALMGESAFGDVHLLLLPLVGFAGGLLASFSPCILPLVPLNVAYIGANEATGWRALGLSLRFVAGATLVLSVLGIFGDLAGLILIEHRGVMLLVVGCALVYFGLGIIEVVPDPFRGRGLAVGRRLGPIGAGAAFSLVTTPCSSPILGAVLAATAAHPVPGLGVATMVSFSFGYTLLVFAGGVFGGGLVAWARRLRLTAVRSVTAALLVALGASLLLSGVLWF